MRTRSPNDSDLVHASAEAPIVGTQFVARSAPDRYTLGMAISARMINPSLQPNLLPYDTTKDLAVVSQLALSHDGLFARPWLPMNSVAELIAGTKKNPRKVSFATPWRGHRHASRRRDAQPPHGRSGHGARAV